MKINDILKEATVILSTVVLSMAGYWLMIGKDLVNRNEVSAMITERERVLQVEIRHLSESRNELTSALQKNTDAINDLRIAIAKLANDK